MWQRLQRQAPARQLDIQDVTNDGRWQEAMKTGDDNRLGLAIFGQCNAVDDLAPKEHPRVTSCAALLRSA